MPRDAAGGPGEMNPRKIARAVSILLWGAVGLVFGVGTALAGAHALPSPGGVLTLLVGAAVVACAYGLHKVTCLGLDRIFRPRP